MEYETIEFQNYKNIESRILKTRRNIELLKFRILEH